MKTVAEIWRSALERHSGAAYLVQDGDGWSPLSWSEASRSIDELALGLMSLGIGRGDRVAVLSRTRVEWTLCDWALLGIGAIVVPIYPTCSPDDVTYILADSEAVAVICEDAEQLGRTRRAAHRLGCLAHFVTIEPAGGDGAHLLADLQAEGAARAVADPAAAVRARDGLGAEDVATIVYTSGTTGEPKGCVLTHGNLCAAVSSVRRVPDLVRGDDTIVLFLPLAHAFGRLCQFAGAEIGGTIAFCPDVALVAQTLVSVKPTLLPTVPRLLEKVHAATVSSIQRAGGPRGWLGRRSLEVAGRVADLRREGQEPSAWLGLQLSLADRLVFAKVRARLGGRVRLVVSGGAALSPHLSEFFETLGIPVIEGYGLSECTALASVGHPERHRIGTVGPAVPGAELRIDPSGEVLVRSGTVFAGYWRDEAATAAATTADGLLRTGDLGELDREGNLTITDRQKDIIVTASGKNVSPQRVENALKTSPLISETLVVGDSRPFLVALITVDGDSKAPDVKRGVEEAVQAANATLGVEERVRRHVIIDREFDVGMGEVTPTLKLRRRVCEERFAAEISELYAGRV